MVKENGPEKFSESETRKRMEAALRGARIAGHKPMSGVAPKREKPAPKASKPKRNRSA